MRILKFSVDGQSLTSTGDLTGIVRGSENYLQCQFIFDKDWANAIKVAEFGQSSVQIKNNACMIPSEVLTGRSFTLRVVGKDGDTRITTNKITIRQGK